MAGDFVMVQFATARKIEVHRIAAALGIPRAHAFGLCVEAWIWFDEQTEDGVAKGATPEMLDAIVGAPGFTQALSNVGWIRVRESSLELPNFDRLMGKSAKKRVNDAIRQRKRRDESPEVPTETEDNDDDNQACDTVANMSQAKRDRNVTKRREEKSISDTDTDTGARREKKAKRPWTDEHDDLQEKAARHVDPLGLGRLDGASVFRSVTDDLLKNPRHVVSWFRRQLSAESPVLGSTEADLLLCVCASMKAIEPGSKKPVAVFVNLIRNRAWRAVERYRERAEDIIEKELSRDSINAA